MEDHDGFLGFLFEPIFKKVTMQHLGRCVTVSVSLDSGQIDLFIGLPDAHFPGPNGGSAAGQKGQKRHGKQRDQPTPVAGEDRGAVPGEGTMCHGTFSGSRQDPDGESIPGSPWRISLEKAGS
jgi:hypothetical protein